MYEATLKASLSGLRRMPDVYTGQDSRSRGRLHKMNEQFDIVMVITKDAIVSIGKGKVSVSV